MTAAITAVVATPLTRAAEKVATVASTQVPVPVEMHPNTSIINTGILTFILAVLAWFAKDRLANRKLTTEVNGEIRQEFIDEMKALRDEVRGLRDENNNLRQEVRQLHGIIDGMRRESQGNAISAGRMMAAGVPAGNTPAIRGMIEQLDRVEGRPE